METKQEEAIERIFEKLAKKGCGEKCEALKVVELGGGSWDVECEQHGIDMLIVI